MPLYNGDFGIVKVRTDSAGVHHLPFGWILVTGETPPAAASGTKTFSGKARCKVSIVASIEKKYLDAVLRNKVSILRCRLNVNGDDGGTTLEGVMHNVVTATCALYVAPRTVNLAGLLACVVSSSGTIFIPGRIEGILRCRTVSNATLKIGITHKPSALLQNKVSVSAILTINYMRALLRMPISASCTLHVAHSLAGIAAVQQRTEVALQVLRAFAADVSLSMTATARLTVPLRGFAAMHVTAQAVPDVQRCFVGSASNRFNASLALRTERMLAGLAAVHQTATMAIDASRLFVGKLYLKTTASASLDVARQLSSLMLCHWTATMNFQPIRPVLAPVFAEVFVNPEMETNALIPGEVMVEEAADSAYVEEDE